MRSRWESIAGLCVLLVIITVAAYTGVFSCGFVSFDDPQYVSENPVVLAGLSAAGWRYAWSTFDCANWHPLTWLSLELDASVFGTNPAGYHRTSLVLHILNVLLVFGTLARVTGSFVRSACVAALFAVHPLHVESVAWIAERKDVLSTFFLLLTVAAYIAYAARPSIVRYMLVLLAFVLGLLSKPMLVTLPLLLLLLDYWPLDRAGGNSCGPIAPRFVRRSPWGLLLEKTPLLALAVADGIMTVMAQRGGGAFDFLGVIAPATRLANALHSYGWYLEKTFLPRNLAVFYPHPGRDLPSSSVAAAGLALALISLAVFGLGRNRRHLIVGWLWFLVSLLPVIGFAQVGGQAHADRYAYVPHIGLFVMIVWELHALLAGTGVGRAILAAGMSVVLLMCGTLTRAQVDYWKDSDTLWTHAADVVEENWLALGFLAKSRQFAGDHEGAIEYFERRQKTTRGARWPDAHYLWGWSLVALNRPAEAEEHFLAALMLNRRHSGALEEFSKLLRAEGREQEAAKVLAQLAEVRPDDFKIQTSAGLALARQGKVSDAVSFFERAVRIAPESAAGNNNLAMALSQLNRQGEAKSRFFRALELDPDFSVAHFNLASILEAEGDIPGAKQHFSEALRINPGDAEAEQHLQRLGTKH